MVRASWVEAHGQEPADPLTLWSADTGRALFRHYALDLLGNCDEDLLDPLNIVRNDVASYITYPARCLRLTEILGLLALLEIESGGVLPKEIPNFLAAFIEKNPGTVHPPSDRWAVSLIPPTLALVRSGHRQQVGPMLQQVVKWVADRYEAGRFGLAGPDASTEEEVERLLGNPFEHVQIERRAGSYTATVVLDLAAVLEMGDLFNVARNEFLAVEIVLPLVEAPDTPTQYLTGGDGLCYTANMEFTDSWKPTDGWKVAPHHQRALTSYLARIGRPWDLLAVSAVLRDRHFVEALRYFGSNDHTEQDGCTAIE